MQTISAIWVHLLWNSVDIISPGGSIFHGLIWKDLAELLQQMSPKLSVWINLSFHLFIFIQGLFHAIFGVQLRVSAFINVSSEQQKNDLFRCTKHIAVSMIYLLKHFQGNMNILYLRL